LSTLTATAAAKTTGGARRRALASWCLFDWANSAYPAIVISFLFSAYFTKAVVADETLGTALWLQMMSITALAIALLSPLLGAIADQGGRRKPWLAVLIAINIAATAALWFVRPESDWTLYALLVVGLATLTFELATVFYNAMLPDIAPPYMVGRLSGWGWGCGYAGGLVCLIIALVVLVLPDPPLFGLDKAQQEPVRATVLLSAVWAILFALPLFLFVPDRASRGVPARQAIGGGLRTLVRTLRALPRHRSLGTFLIANMIFLDGLNTLFVSGGIYAAVAFDMDLQEVLIFGILLNVAAGIGAVGFAWIDDWIGAKPTILISLSALTVFGIAVLLVQDKILFYALAMAIGVFIGPAQAAGRSLMARMAPPDLRAEFFGLFALSGKATSFVGPALVGWVTYAADSQRVGMGVIPVFFVLGLLLLLRVREPRG
jgi:UMF1 family MFS transporter